jgi:hypothetical protein
MAVMAVEVMDDVAMLGVTTGVVDVLAMVVVTDEDHGETVVVIGVVEEDSTMAVDVFN